MVRVTGDCFLALTCYFALHRTSAMSPERYAIRFCVLCLFIGLQSLTHVSLGAACVPEVQHRPSLDRPFIYIHQRKTGGSSVRHAALTGAEQLHLNSTAFIPCEQNVSCATFAPNTTLQRFSIYAGHFNWYTVMPDKDEFACLTSFRHPLDRAVSCLHFRFPKKMRDVQLQNLTTKDFESLLRDTYHDSNASCNNEAVIMMSRIADARKFEALMRDRVAAEEVVREAIANVQKCVVLVHGMDDGSLLDAGTHLSAWNAKMLTHFFPWLPEVGKLMVNPHPQLPAHLLSVVYELNWPELLMYQAALRQFHAQQSVLATANA